jgi:hypothetical protein
MNINVDFSRLDSVRGHGFGRTEISEIGPEV